jgi:Ca2+-binding RTX toxin-like protein
MTTGRVVRRLALLLPLAVGASLALAIPEAQAAPRCFGKPATIVGTSKNDVLKGTDGADVIVGLGGKDVILARAGDDRVCAGGDDDQVDGQGGSDKLKGNGGADLLVDRGGKKEFNLIQGNGGSDFVFASNSPDKIIGGPGSDILRGRDRNDRILGGGGFDVLVGEGGHDLLNGGAGVFDRVSYFNAFDPVTVNLGTGTATGAGNDTLRKIEDIEGSKHDDTLQGNGGSNFIFGLGGNDEIDGAGAFDYALFGGSQSGITANLDTNSASGQGNDTLLNIEGLGGTAVADDFTGDEGPNALFTFGGSDSLAGGAEDDLLDGGNGNDTGDGGTHVDGDRCLSIENASNCEIFTGKVTNRSYQGGPARARFTPTAILSETS